MISGPDLSKTIWNDYFGRNRFLPRSNPTISSMFISSPVIFNTPDHFESIAELSSVGSNGDDKSQSFIQN
uniref:Uncharacterized protein n=1 Tax=Tetranychus urticae TaxID=32264 RepID=A0A158P4J9_TETUR